MKELDAPAASDDVLVDEGEPAPETQKRSFVSRIVQCFRLALYGISFVIVLDVGCGMYRLHYGPAPVRESAPACGPRPLSFDARENGNIFNVEFTAESRVPHKKVLAKIHEGRHGLCATVNGLEIRWDKRMSIVGAVHTADSLISEVVKRGDRIYFYSEKLGGSAFSVHISTLADIAEALEKQKGDTCTVSISYRLERRGLAKAIPISDEGTVKITLQVER